MATHATVGQEMVVSVQWLMSLATVLVLLGICYLLFAYVMLRKYRPIYLVLGTEDAFRRGWRFFNKQLSGEDLSPEAEELLVSRFLGRHLEIYRRARAANIFSFVELVRAHGLRDQELHREIVEHVHPAARDKWLAMSAQEKQAFGNYFRENELGVR